MTNIFLVGDSTMAIKESDKRPETGWGEKIKNFLKDEIIIHNFAINGRSSKSFIEEGVLDTISDLLEEGDFLFIQFGHNDQKKEDASKYTDPQTTFKEYLSKYVEVARNNGANPLFLTPIYRRYFDELNNIKEDVHQGYDVAMTELANKLNVPIIDMTSISKEYLRNMGELMSRKIYLILAPGEHFNYPEGITDNTHFSDLGATIYAQIIAGEIKKLGKKFTVLLK